jgi:hypothetical protein
MPTREQVTMPARERPLLRLEPWTPAPEQSPRDRELVTQGQDLDILSRSLGGSNRRAAKGWETARWAKRTSTRRDHAETAPRERQRALTRVDAIFGTRDLRIGPGLGDLKGRGHWVVIDPRALQELACSVCLTITERRRRGSMPMYCRPAYSARTGASFIEVAWVRL